MKNKLLIIILIIILLVLVSFIGYGIYYKNKNNNEIKKASLTWYNDQNKAYNQTTIGTLYKNGYINDNKTLILKKNRDCQIIEIENNQAKITNEYDCELNKKLQQVPIFEVKLTNINDNSNYEQNTWTASDIKVDLIFKDSEVTKNIERKYISHDNQKMEELVIKTDEYIDDIYTINIVLKDGSTYSKDFKIMIDKTAPIFTEKKITDISYTAIFNDDQSDIKEVLYYISNTTYAPVVIEQFMKKEDIQLAKEKTYHIWAVAINGVGISSEYVYLGEFKRKPAPKDE